jgi:hypothetical protein
VIREFLVRVRDSAKERGASRSFYRDWDRARAEATSPNHRAEIDALFRRNMN